MNLNLRTTAGREFLFLVAQEMSSCVSLALGCIVTSEPITKAREIGYANWFSQSGPTSGAGDHFYLTA